MKRPVATRRSWGAALNEALRRRQVGIEKFGTEWHFAVRRIRRDQRFTWALFLVSSKEVDTIAARDRKESNDHAVTFEPSRPSLNQGQAASSCARRTDGDKPDWY